jgi:hypothetical protein
VRNVEWWTLSGADFIDDSSRNARLICMHCPMDLLFISHRRRSRRLDHLHQTGPKSLKSILRFQDKSSINVEK